MNTTLREDVRVEIQRSEQAGIAVRRVLETLADEINNTAPEIGIDRDPRNLHRFRIATRRTRAVFSALKAVFSRDGVHRFGRDLRWIARLTGPARDLDVFVMRIESTDLRQRPVEVAPIDRLVDQDRKYAFADLDEALASDRFRAFSEDWTTHLSTHSDVPRDASTRPAIEVASSAIRGALDRVVRQTGVVLEARETPEAAVHRLRISCKKVRYLIEAFASLYDADEVEHGLTHLRRLQDAFGDYNDAVLQLARLDRYENILGQSSAGWSALDALRLELNGVAESRQSEFVDLMRAFVEPANLEGIDGLFASPEDRS